MVQKSKVSFFLIFFQTLSVLCIICMIWASAFAIAHGDDGWSNIYLLLCVVVSIPVFVACACLWRVAREQNLERRGLANAATIFHAILAIPFISIPAAKTAGLIFAPFIELQQEKQVAQRFAGFKNAQQCVMQEINKTLAQPQTVIRTIGQNLILQNGWAVRLDNPWQNLIDEKDFEASLTKLVGKTIAFTPGRSYSFGGVGEPFNNTNLPVPQICENLAGEGIPVNLTNASDRDMVFVDIAKKVLGPDARKIDCNGQDKPICAYRPQFSNGCAVAGYFAGLQVKTFDECQHSLMINMHAGCHYSPMGVQKITLAMILTKDDTAWIAKRDVMVDPHCNTP